MGRTVSVEVGRGDLLRIERLTPEGCMCETVATWDGSAGGA